MKMNIFIPLSVVLLGIGVCDKAAAVKWSASSSPVTTVGNTVFNEVNYRATIDALYNAQGDRQQLLNLVNNNQLQGANDVLYVLRNEPSRVTDVRPPFNVQQNRDPVTTGEFFEVDLVTYALFHNSIAHLMIRQIPEVMLARALAVRDEEVRLELIDQVVRGVNTEGMRVLRDMQVPVRLHQLFGNDNAVVNVPVLAARAIRILRNGADEYAYRSLTRLGLNNDAGFTAIYRALDAVNANGAVYRDVVEAIEAIEMLASDYNIDIDYE